MAVESVVRRALEYFYNDKYRELEGDSRKKMIETHLKAILPNEVGVEISKSGMSRQGYRMGRGPGNFGPPMKSVKDIIDNSGYRLVYDSFSEGLEHIYFWILDWMRDTYWGVGYDVAKTMDKFEASAGSGFFGDLGSRASIMQDRAMKLLGTINTVIRSVINILYDLKEFDQRLQLYKELQSGNEEKERNARLALKQFWMDRVDIQRGRASINMLSQQLQFVTLRDAFMKADSPEEVAKPVEKGGMDLNERVKRILGPRIADYLAWEKLSGRELERRYKIERNYLKSQVESLKLYAQWAKPYLQAANRLQGDLTRSPDLVTTFNTLQVQATLLGTKKGEEYYSAIEVSFDYRTVPHTARQAQSVHYVQGGRVDIQFRGFALSEDEKKAIEDFEFHEALQLANINEEMIREIEDAVDDYLESDEEEFKDPRERLGFLQRLVEQVDEDEKFKDKSFRRHVVDEIEKLKKVVKEEKTSKSPGPFKALYDSFKVAPSFAKKIIPKKTKIVEGDRGKAAKDAAGSAYAIYLVYKKAHGMPTE